MPTLNVCPRCRNICAKCHSTFNPARAHSLWVCTDCWRKKNNKCGACGGNKNGPGTIGTGKVCDKCYKMNKCAFCGERV